MKTAHSNDVPISVRHFNVTFLNRGTPRNYQTQPNVTRYLALSSTTNTI